MHVAEVGERRRDTYMKIKDMVRKGRELEFVRYYVKACMRV